MTPEEVAAIRARGYTANEIALCDALEEAWAERDALPVVANVDYWEKYLWEKDRAARAEAQRDLFRTQAHLAHEDWMRAEAALARIRDLCDKQGFDITPAQVRAALDGGDQ